MNNMKRDGRGRFIHGHKADIPRDGKGRFMKKVKEKPMDKKQDISMVEKQVDKLLKKHRL